MSTLLNVPLQHGSFGAGGALRDGSPAWHKFIRADKIVVPGPDMQPSQTMTALLFDAWYTNNMEACYDKGDPIPFMPLEQLFEMLKANSDIPDTLPEGDQKQLVMEYIARWHLLTASNQAGVFVEWPLVWFCEVPFLINAD